MNQRLLADLYHMADLALNLATNDELRTVNQNLLVKQDYRVPSQAKKWEICAKELADGSKAVALFNLSDL